MGRLLEAEWILGIVSVDQPMVKVCVCCLISKPNVLSALSGFSSDVNLPTCTLYTIHAILCNLERLCIAIIMHTTKHWKVIL